MITIHAQGATLKEIADKFIDGVETNTLISLLSKRLEANGQLLMIHDKGEIGGDAAVAGMKQQAQTQQPSAASDKQQKAAAAAAKKKADAEAKAKADADAKAKADAEAAGGDDFGADDGDGDATITIQDVKAALDAFKAKKGLVDARRIMVEEGGSSKLIDIPAENYSKIIAALKAAE